MKILKVVVLMNGFIFSASILTLLAQFLNLVHLNIDLLKLNEMKASKPNTDMNGVSTQNQEKTEQHI
ncbi:hypothetical protein H9I48_00430 [Wolbachia pipientis]|uniref:hypothetical protein n=1 Tax=Wolbachia pipientis TaxID=955 RepID=UPI0016513D46|nr:hypothetical protein [Wolbachia pipientis]MBC6685733.1 hypothetical protein [Wolbachia pipientis]